MLRKITNADVNKDFKNNHFISSASCETELNQLENKLERRTLLYCFKNDS